MIDLDRLRFPSGVAVTTIIRSGSAGLGKAKLLGLGFLISAIWKLIMVSGVLDTPGLLEHEELNISFGIIPDYLSPVLYLSLMNLAAGLLAGRGGLPFFAGGVIAWWVISPTAVMSGWIPTEVETNAMSGFIYSKMLRLPSGALIGGALWVSWLAFPP